MVDVLDRKAMRAKAAELLADLGVAFRPTARAGTLGVGHQQMVEICRAMWADAKLIIMDEPTSSLSEKEAEDLFRVIAQMKARGVTVLFISHRLEEVRRQLRPGHGNARRQDRGPSGHEGQLVDEIIKLMVGRNIQNKYPKVAAQQGDAILSVRELNRKGVLHDISFTSRPARCWASPGWWAPGAPRRCARSPARTLRIPAASRLTGKPVSHPPPAATPSTPESPS